MITFTNPLLLWAFPILALPWILRRRQEERIKHVDFPLLRFLMESQEKELINPHLQEILLLILRTLILALLLFALAGPKWVTESGIGGRMFSFLPFGRSFQSNVVAIDSSYSMGYGQGENSWWSRASRTTDQISSDLRGISTAWIRWDENTVSASPAQRLIPLSEAERLNLFQSDPEALGSSIFDLDRSLRENFEGNENYIVLTDGQRLPWESLLNSDPPRSSLLPLLVVTVGSEPITNAWIEVDTLSSPPWGIAGWETIAGTIYSMRQEEGEEGTISIVRRDTGEIVYSKSIAFPASPFLPVPLPFVFSTRYSDLTAGTAQSAPNQLNFQLQLRPEDPLSWDNEITLEVPAIESFTVAIPGIADAPDPLQRVLAAAYRTGTNTPSPVQVQFFSTPVNLNPELNLSIIAQHQVPWWTQADNTQAVEYVKNGGALILFTGGIESGNMAWNQLLIELGWTWIPHQSESEETDSISVSVSGNSLLAQSLASWEENAWLNWISSRHGTLSQAQPLVVYNLQNQVYDLISEKTLGKGRVWIVNAALTVDSPVFLSPLLPAILWETAKDVARVQQNFPITLPKPKAESNLTLLNDEEKAFLQEKYRITFTTPEQLTEELNRLYGGSDLRMILLFSLLALALVESWLSNRLASI